MSRRERINQIRVCSIERTGRKMPQADKLRKLAAWYREFAEQAGEPAIWDMRLKTAEKLEAEAIRLAFDSSVAYSGGSRPPIPK